MQRPASLAATWAVIFETPNQPAKRVVLDKPVTVGREASCDVVLAGIGVSREHARLEAALDGVKISDLGSTNGTFVNGKKIEGTVVLKPGDTAGIGDTACKLSKL